MVKLRFSLENVYALPNSAQYRTGLLSSSSSSVHPIPSTLALSPCSPRPRSADRLETHSNSFFISPSERR